MADTRQYVQGQDYFIAGSGVTAGATSVTLKSFQTPDGVDLTMADFGTVGYGVYEPETNREENFTFTGVTANADGTRTLTGVTSGLGFVAPYTSDPSRQNGHNGNATVRISNTAPFYDNFANRNNDETINETWTFSTTDFPRMSDAVTDPVDDEELATKRYVDNTAGGSPISINRVVVAATAGATIAAGDLVYLDEADTEWKLADATDTATIYSAQIGIAQGAGTDGNAITGGVLLRGLDANQTGLTTNSLAYATDVAGTIGTTPGTNEKVIGSVISATEVLFDPTFNDMPTAGEKDALVGSSGDPGSTNPYITENDTSNGATITATTIAFVDSNPDTITDSGSGFVTAGFRAGQTITVSGSASNDGTYTIASVVAGTITLDTADSLTVEAAGASVTINADVNNKVVRKDANGEIFVPDTPVSGTSAINENYFNANLPSRVERLASMTSDVTVSNSTTETDLLTATVPADYLSTNGVIQGRIYIQNLDLRSVGAPNCRFRLKFGSTLTATINYNSDPNPTTGFQGYVDFSINMTGATNTQQGAIQTWVSRPVADLNGNGGDAYVQYATDTGTEDTTSTVDFSVTVQFTDANASNNITVQNGYANITVA